MLGHLKCYLIITKQIETSKIQIFCTLWSIVVGMFPTITNQNSISTYEQHLINLDINSLDFSYGLRTEDTPELESKINLNLNVFELNVNVKDDLNVTSIPLLFCI